MQKQAVLVLLFLILLVSNVEAASNTINNTAVIKVIGIPAGAVLPIRYSPAYITNNYNTTNWTTNLKFNINGQTTLQYQGAGTTVSLNGNVYTFNSSKSNLGLSAIIMPANTYIWDFSLYFSPQLWNQTQANELIAAGVPANSSIIISLIGNTTNSVTYGTKVQGNVLAAGSVDKYAVYNSVNGTVNFIKTSIVKASASPCIFTNLNNLAYCSNATTPLSISVPDEKGYPKVKIA
jgi:hypothetical protein